MATTAEKPALPSITVDQAVDLARCCVIANQIDGFELSDSIPSLPGFVYRDRSASIGISVGIRMAYGQPLLGVTISVPAVNVDPFSMADFLALVTRANQLAARIQARFVDQPLVF